ncbi:MBL fold metallo-hydrolase [Streptomyces olivaceoviridis]
MPSFPGARYLLPAADDHHFGPAGGYAGGTRPVDRLVYEDSVAPVHRAGQAVLWEDAYRVDGHLVLESAPGHTPGSAVLRVQSRGERAVFVGDLPHSPVRILRPGCGSRFCLDPGRRRASGSGCCNGRRRNRRWWFRRTSAGSGRWRHGFSPHRWAA